MVVVFCSGVVVFLWYFVVLWYLCGGVFVVVFLYGVCVVV